VRVLLGRGVRLFDGAGPVRLETAGVIVSGQIINSKFRMK